MYAKSWERLSPLAFLVVLLITAFISGQSNQKEISLDEALELALQNHQGLLASTYEAQGSGHLIEQSSRRMNPTLVFQTENWRFTGDPHFNFSDDLDVYAYLSQPIERGDKRNRRTDVASEDLRLAELRRDEYIWELRQEVRIAFWKAQSLQKELELFEESERLFEDVVNYHQVMVQQGAVPEADLIRVRLEASRLHLLVEEARIRVERSLQELVQAMGLSDPFQRFSLVDEPPADLQQGGETRESLLGRVRQRPDVRATHQLVEVARRRADLEAAAGKPNWDLVFGYQRIGGADAVLAGVAIPLPVFDKNEGNLAFRLTEVSVAEVRYEQKLRQAKGEVSEALLSLGKRSRLLQELKGMLDEAGQSWEIARAAYEEGASDLLRLIDAQRALNDVRLLETRTRFELQVELVRLERAVGEEGLQINLEVLDID